MKILVIGSRGSAHGIVRKLAQSKEVTEICVTPWSDAMQLIRLVSNEEPVGRMDLLEVNNAKKVVEYAFSGSYDLVVPIHESCLETGLGDMCRKCGIPFAGPCRRGANFELSKTYTQEFSERHKLPIATGRVHQTIGGARDYALKLLKGFGGCVVKADGSARGKGVYGCRSYAGVGESIQEIIKE